MSILSKRFRDTFSGPSHPVNGASGAISEIFKPMSYQDVLNNDGLSLYEKEKAVDGIFAESTRPLWDDFDARKPYRADYEAALLELYMPYVKPESIDNASNALHDARIAILKWVRNTSEISNYRIAQLQLLTVSLMILSIVKNKSIDALIAEKWSIVTILKYDSERASFLERLWSSPLYTYEGSWVLRLAWSNDQNKRVVVDGLHSCSPEQLCMLESKWFAISGKFLRKWA